MGGLPAGEAIRVLLADDHRLFAEALRSNLAQDRRVEVVGIAFDGAEAVRMAAELSPDIVLMDVDMPGMDGIEATRLIRAAEADVQVLIVSGDESVDAGRARDAGAAGFVRKDRSAVQLVEAIPEISTLVLAFGGDRGS